MNQAEAQLYVSHEAGQEASRSGSRSSRSYQSCSSPAHVGLRERSDKETRARSELWDEGSKSDDRMRVF